MTKQDKEMIETTIKGFVGSKKCDKCGHEMNVNILPYINFTVNPEYFEPTKELFIFKAECPKCGNMNHYTFDTMLVDEKNKWILYLLNDTANIDKFKYQIRYFMETEINKEGNKDLDSYTTRLVFTQQDLVEKMVIFEKGLNDKVIEIMKSSLYSQNIFDRSKYDKVLFDAVNVEDESLMFVGINTKTSTVEPKVVGIKYSFYNSVIDKLGGISSLKEKDMFDVIDLAWANRQLEI